MTAPTGSGKTWIQGLIAKYYCCQGKGVTIVEPNEILRLQTLEKLSVVDPDIKVATITQFYQYGTPHKLVILNEYDSVVTEQPYHILPTKLTGLWALKGKSVIAFTATTSLAHERLVHNCITPPLPLRFKSEYELVHGSCPVQPPNIVTCRDSSSLMAALSADVEVLYDKKPIIVIYDWNHEVELLSMVRTNNRRYCKGADAQALSEIRQWDYGILLIQGRECRGVDTRFAVDAAVLIVSKADSLHQVQQMSGRSSRTRGVCESTLYVVTAESRSQVMERLRRSSISQLGDLEKLLALMEHKSKDYQLMKIAKDVNLINKRITSISQLESKMDANAYLKLTRDFQL